MFIALSTLLSGIALTLVVINNIPYTYTIIDIGHSLLPVVDRKKYGWINEIAIFSQIIFSLTIPMEDIMNCMTLIGIFYWIRAFTIPLTIAPSIKNENETVKWYGIFGGVNDLLPFSGHTGVIVITLLYIHKFYGPVIGLTFFVYSFLNSLFIIVLRNHYTIEVVLSWLFCPLLYNWYEG